MKKTSDQPTSSLDSIWWNCRWLVGRAAVGSNVQLETYLGEAAISQEGKPLQYWMATLAKLAGRYLSAPCTSVDSERLFRLLSVTHCEGKQKQAHSWSYRNYSFHQKERASHFPKKSFVQRPHHCMLTEVWYFVWFKCGHSAIGSQKMFIFQLKF